MTATEKRALKIAPTISRDGLFTCGMLGEALWAEERFKAWKTYPENVTNRFCRPAGKIIRALVAKGKMVACSRPGDGRFFYRVQT